MGQIKRDFFFILSLSLLTLTKLNAQDTIIVATEEIKIPLITRGCYQLQKNGLYTSLDSLKKKIEKDPILSKYHGCDTLTFDNLTFDKNDLLLFTFREGSSSKTPIKVTLYKIPSLKKYFFLINATFDTYGPSTLVYINVLYRTKKLNKHYSFEYKFDKNFIDNKDHFMNHK